MSYREPPMEPVSWPEPFDDPLWQFEIKWDGVRCRAECAAGEVRLFSRNGSEWTAKFPELTRILCTYSGVFDGEICALQDGRPNFPRMLRRLGNSTMGPAHYIVFDCLRNADGDDIRSQPLEVRQAAIPQFPEGTVHPVEPIMGRGRSLFSVVEASGLEGIVAKRLGSRYASGKNGDWRKVKCWRTLVAKLGRVEVRAGEIRSLELLGEAGEPIGSVGPLSPNASRQVLRRLQQGGVLLCRIRYLEWTDAGRIRQPVFIGLED